MAKVEKEIKKPTIKERIKDLKIKKEQARESFLMLTGAIEVLERIEKEG